MLSGSIKTMGQESVVVNGAITYPPVKGMSVSDKNVRGAFFCRKVVKCLLCGVRKSTKVSLVCI